MAVRSAISSATDYGETTNVYTAWPISWSAVWIGVLTALAVGLVVGLAGVALGAHQEATAGDNRMGFGELFFAVAGAFFSFVAGGWVAARIAGIWREETAALHGAIVWLLAVPLLLLLAGLGAGSFYGSWMGDLAGTPVWANPVPVNPIEVRNNALGAVTALLLGLMGGVLGAWLGANMNETDYKRTRTIR